MAGIFNLFGDVNGVNKGETTKSLMGPKMTLGTPGMTGKAVNSVKPKGLSIRSTSDLNIPINSRIGSAKSASTSKQQDYLKPKITQLDSNGRPISPRGKNFSTKKHSVEQIKVKELSVQKKSPVVKSTKLHKQSDKAVFKKPFTPKKSIYKSVYPGKENLASYYDFQNNFENLRTVSMKSEFAHLLRMKDDYEFYADIEPEPEKLFCPAVPKLHVSPLWSDEEYEEIPLLDLPELSDNGEDF